MVVRKKGPAGVGFFGQMMIQILGSSKILISDAFDDRLAVVDEYLRQRYLTEAEYLTI